MLISCNSCNSKYLINSADLKPEGRVVQCVNCRNQWYQEPIITEEDSHENKQDTLIVTKSNNNFSSKEFHENKNSGNVVANLPSTFVKEEKVSVINSLLVIFLMLFLIIVFWIIQNTQINSFVLFKFYINEFFFNFKLIISDVAKIIHRIINYIIAN